MVERADGPSPIVLTPKLVERVYDEVRATDYEDLRRKELAFVKERNFSLYQLFGAMYEATLKNYGEEEARRAATGFLFAHRVLRYGNNDLPLPHRSLDQADAILQQTSKDTAPGEKDIQETMFEDRYKDHQYLIDRVNSLSSTTQFGARQMFILYADAIGETVSTKKPTLGDTINRAYVEVKASDLDEFFSTEMTGLKKANQPLYQQIVEDSATLMVKYGEEEVTKFTVGISLAHRILRYARGNQPLPPKSSDDCEAVIRDAIEKSNATNESEQTEFETAFRERFKEKPELIDFVYDTLTQRMTRRGVEFLLLIYADELAPQTEASAPHSA